MARTMTKSVIDLITKKKGSKAAKPNGNLSLSRLNNNVTTWPEPSMNRLWIREYNPSRRSEREEASCEATTPKRPKSRHTTVVNRNIEISRVLIRIRFYESGTAAYTPLNIRRRCEVFTPKKREQRDGAGNYITILQKKGCWHKSPGCLCAQAVIGLLQK